jgi:hypothetical protein
MHIATATEIEVWTAREWELQRELRTWLALPDHVEIADQIGLEIVDLALVLHQGRHHLDRPDTQFVVQSFWRCLYGLPMAQSVAVGEALRLAEVPWPALYLPE